MSNNYPLINLNKDCSTNRIEWLDKAKGFGMILVLLGHAPCPFILTKYIYAFHVPLFFFLSGYLFSVKKYDRFKGFFGKKVNSLVVPYFTFSFLCYFCFLILHFLLKNGIGIQGINGLDKYMNIYTPLYGQFLGLRGEAYTVHNEPLWFVTCLFVTEIAFYFILKHFSSCKKLCIVLLFFAICGYLYGTYVKIPLFWNIDPALTAIVFYGIGYITRNNNVLEKIKNAINIKSLLILFFINLIFGMMNSRVDMYHCSNGNFFFFYISAIAGIFMTIMLFSIFSKFKILSFIGKNSLIFLALHEFIVFRIFNFVIQRLFPDYTFQGISLLFESILYVAGAVVVLIPVVYVINNYMPFMLGRKKQILYTESVSYTNPDTSLAG